MSEELPYWMRRDGWDKKHRTRDEGGRPNGGYDFSHFMPRPEEQVELRPAMSHSVSEFLKHKRPIKPSRPRPPLEQRLDELRDIFNDNEVLKLKLNEAIRSDALYKISQMYPKLNKP